VASRQRSDDGSSLPGSREGLQAPRLRDSLPLHYLARAMFMTQIPVMWTPLSALHDPPHEILSGQLQPYFESPQRVSLILDSIFAHEECKTRFDKVQLDWEREEVGEDWVWDSLRAVHGEDYLEFLRDIYEEWIAEGGSKVSSV
jgi:hypothetical protein